VARIRSYVLAVVMGAVAIPTAARAQADEIQVYDGGLAAKGVFNLTLHNNYTGRHQDTGVPRRGSLARVAQRRARVGVRRQQLVRARVVLAALQPG
jgi:hypothetical protein